MLNRIARQSHLSIVNDIHEINRISTEENTANITRLIGDIQQEIARQLNKHNEMVSHYMVVHGYIIAMEKQIKKLSKQLHTISADDVLSVMGYTQDWRNIKKL